MDFVQDNPGETVPEENSPTCTYCGHQSSLICFIHLILSMAFSLFNPRAWESFPHSLSKFSFVYLLAWHPAFHTPYISSPNRCLLFATHAHTIATCFAVVPRLCHLILVSLSHNPKRCNLSTTAKQVAMVWAHAAKRRQWLGEGMEYEAEGIRPRGRPNKIWRDYEKRLSGT